MYFPASRVLLGWSPGEEGRERNDSALFALHSLPPSLGCIPAGVKVDRAVFKQAQDLGHSFFICSASPISQIYCSCERHLCLSLRARLASNTRCKIALCYRTSERQCALTVQCFFNGPVSQKCLGLALRLLPHQQSLVYL